MKKNKLWIIAAAVFVLLFAGAAYLYTVLSDEYSPQNITSVQTEPSGSQSETSNAAPDFEAVDENGNTVKLSDYRGKPVVVNFWASWCPPCKSEMPHFETAFREYEDVQFLMVNMTTSDRESLDAAKKFIHEEGYTFPVLYDTEGNAAYTYGASSLPMTFFVDSDGNFVTYAVGMISYDNLEQGIEMITEK